MKNFFLILLLLFPFLGMSQTVDVRFDGVISNMDLGKKETGVSVAIVQGGQTISSGTTSSNGKYSVKGKIDVNKPFDVVFSKSGFTSKKINFDFKGINLEDTPSGDFKPVESLDMDLFAERPGVDFSFLDTQPVGKFTWDSKGYAKLDDNARKVMADRIDKLLKDSEQNAKNNELAYSEAIKAADKAYTEKKYEEAMSKYEQALGIPGKSKEQHPINRINEIDGILQKQKEDQLKFNQENANYINLIKAADNLRDSGDLEKAKQKYQEASDLKDDEQYPIDQIAGINKKIKEKETDAQYKKLIEAADLLAKQKSYRSARDNYLEASKLKKDEQYPKDKLKELESFIKAEEDAAALKQKYEELVAQGEQLVKEEKWEDAKTKFKEALEIEKASTYVKGQLEIIEKKLGEIKAQKEKEEKIASLIKEGDQAKTDKSYDAALAKYREVLVLDKENAVVPPKITEVEQLISDAAKNKELNDKFDALVKQGDEAVGAKKYQDAVARYTEAIGLKEDAAVKAKKEAAEKALADLAKTEQLEADFKKLIEEGKTAETAKDYAGALVKYTSALDLKPADEPTQKKVNDIKKLISEEQSAAALQQQIEQLIQEGISLMEGGVMDGPQLEPAKEKFKEVLSLDKANKTATDRIAQIEKLLTEQKSLADKEAKFAESVAKGDAETASQSWEKAIGFYNVALGIKEDAGVREKVAQAQEKLNELASAKKTEEEYQKAIKDADGLRDGKKYTEALSKYEAAKGLKPSETYPQQEINKIGQLLADEKSAADKQQQITSLLAEGEALFGQKEYQNARAKFVQVQQLDAENTTAKKRIGDIDSELTKLEGEAVKQQQIANLIQEGEQLFTNAQYQASETKFKEVQSLDPTNSIAQKYLADIAAKLAEQKQQADSKQKFEALVSQGDAAVSNEKWQDAIAAYDGALLLQDDSGVKQKRDAARQKLGELTQAQENETRYTTIVNAANSFRDSEHYPEALAKYKEAQSFKPGETYPQQEIDKINQILAGKQSAEQQKQQIAALLAEGQTHFSAQDYPTAKAKYQAVLNLDNSNAAAQSKMAEIADIENALASKQQKEKQFQEYKTNGIQAFNNQDYNNAMIHFEQALKIQDDSEIKGIIDQITSLRTAQNQQKAEIDALLAKGKAAFDQKNWDSAKNSYNEVLKIEAGNATAKTQLALIESEIANEQNAARDSEEFNRLKTQGFAEAQAQEWEKAKHSLEQALKIRQDQSVSQKLDEVNGIIAAKLQTEKMEQEYASAISKAQLAEASSDYSNAISQYNRANSLKPSEQLTTKISELKKLQEQQNALSAIDTKYNNLLAEGDDLVSRKEFTAAIQKYNDALGVKPNEQLPVIKAKEAERLAAEQQKSEEDAAFEKVINAITTKIEENDFKKAREYVGIASSLRPNDPRPAALASKIESLEKENAAFTGFMDKATRETANKNYQEAITLYEKAKSVKPSHPEPAAKIEALRQLLADAANSADKEKMYEQYYNAGVAKQTSQEYDLALNNYKNALNVKPNDAKTIQKIGEVESIIAQLEAEKKARQETDAAFNKLVKEGDEYFNGKAYQKAVESYRLALAERPDNAYVKAQLAEADKLNKIDSRVLARQQYQKILDIADNHLRSKNYDKAIEYYNRALSINSNDAYPRNKINEINGILNPTTESSDELADLGEPFDGSILDGEMALKDAEAQRKEAKQSKIKKANEKAIVSNIELNENKKAELEATINSLYNLYGQMIQKNKDKSADKVEIASMLHVRQHQQNDLDISFYNYERQSVSLTQEILDLQREKVSVEFSESTKKQQDNHLDIDKVRILEEDRTVSKSVLKYDENQQVDNDLTVITNNIADNAYNSSLDKVLIAKDVDSKRTEAEDKSVGRTAQNYDESVENKEKVEKVNMAVSERNEVNTGQLIENNQKLNRIDHSISDKNTNDSRKNHHQSIGVDAEMKGIKNQVTENETAAEVVRVQNVETLKNKKNELEVNEDLRDQNNALKNNDTKVLIEQQEIRKGANDERASTAHKDKVKDVSIVEASTSNAQTELNRSDNSERLLTQSEMNIKKAESSSKAQAEEEFIRQKGDQVKELSKVISTGQASKSSEKANSIHTTKSEIDKVGTQTTEVTIIPNALGEKYPEGVSQEMYQRKDDAGILTAIVTRRVVVIQGRGTEYIRTQTNHAITYTKNGSPITEYVWQRETQDANLQRHY